MREAIRRGRDPLLLLALSSAIGAAVLLGFGVWGWGVATLLAAALLLVARGGRRPAASRPETAGLRARARVLARVVAARSRGELEVFRARRDYAELEADRARLFRELGEAVYAADVAGEEAARQALDAVGPALAEKETQIEALIRDTEARVRRAQAADPDRPA